MTSLTERALKLRGILEEIPYSALALLTSRRCRGHFLARSLH